MQYEQLVREMNDSIALIDDAALRYDIDAELLRYAWDASKHPRGGKNKGHFAKKSGGGARGESGTRKAAGKAKPAKATKPKPKAAKPSSKKHVAPASKTKPKGKPAPAAKSANPQTSTVRTFDQDDWQDAFRWGKKAFASAERNFTPKEIEAINKYEKAGNYQRINSSLREGRLPDDQHSIAHGLADAVRQIDSAMQKSIVPETLLAHRGVQSIDAVAPNVPIGGTYVDRGYSSTTLTRNFANSDAFGKETIHITIPAGSHGIWLDGVRDKGRSPESELLLPRGSTFRVDSFSSDGLSMNVTLLSDNSPSVAPASKTKDLESSMRLAELGVKDQESDMFGEPIKKPTSTASDFMNDAIDAAPDDPAEVINQAEAAQPKVDEAMSEVDLPPEAKKAAEAIVDEHTDTLMTKLKRYGKDAAKLVGGLGLLGVSAGLGLGSLTLGAAAISTSISSGVAGTDIALSGAMGIAMCPMAWGAAACLASGLDLMASIGRHARESDMPMDEIKKIAREYYDGIMQDWKKAWKPEWANSGRRAKQSYHAMISQRGGK